MARLLQRGRAKRGAMIVTAELHSSAATREPAPEARRDAEGGPVETRGREPCSRSRAQVPGRGSRSRSAAKRPGEGRGSEGQTSRASGGRGGEPRQRRARGRGKREARPALHAMPADRTGAAAEGAGRARRWQTTARHGPAQPAPADITGIGRAVKSGAIPSRCTGNSQGYPQGYPQAKALPGIGNCLPERRGAATQQQQPAIFDDRGADITEYSPSGAAG